MHISVLKLVNIRNELHVLASHVTVLRGVKYKVLIHYKYKMKL